jgi:hypothetical protein
MVKSYSELSFGERLKRVVAIGTLGALGTTGIAACGPSASAEKVPAATTTTGATETPSPSVTEIANTPAKNEAERLGQVINKDYEAYLAALTPEQQADIKKLQSENIVKLSPAEVTKAFELPAALVTKDGTLDTVDKDALAVALAARTEAISTLVNSEMNGSNVNLTEGQITAEITPFYQAATHGYWSTNEDLLPPKNLYALALRADTAEAFKNPKAYGDDFSKFYSPYVLHATYVKGTVNASPVEDGVIKMFNYEVHTQDNYPAEAVELAMGIKDKPFDTTILDSGTANVRIENGNIVIDAAAPSATS